jgi:hypothetical protein
LFHYRHVILGGDQSGKLSSITWVGVYFFVYSQLERVVPSRKAP